MASPYRLLTPEQIAEWEQLVLSATPETRTPAGDIGDAVAAAAGPVPYGSGLSQQTGVQNQNRELSRSQIALMVSPEDAASAMEVIRNTPEYQALDTSRRERGDALGSLAAIRPQLDLSPAMALVDAWTGSNLSKNYQRPESQAQMQERILKHLDEQREAEQGLSDFVLKGLAAQKGGGYVLGENAVERLSTDKKAAVDPKQLEKRLRDVNALTGSRLDSQRKNYREAIKDIENLYGQVGKMKSLLPKIRDPQEASGWETAKDALALGWKRATGSDALMDPEDKRLEQLKTGIAALKTYMTSGKAVTQREFDNMREILGGFSFASKASIVSGLNDLLDEMRKLTRSAEIAFPDAAADFRQKGGFTSERIEGVHLDPKEAQFKETTPPKTPKKDRSKMTLEELEAEAAQRGIR